MSYAVYRDVNGEIHPKSETSIHHIYARSLTGGGRPRKFINQYVLTPRMLDEFHNTTDKALHNNVGLLAPPQQMFVVNLLQGIINDLDSCGQYNQLIEYVDRVDGLSTTSNNAVIRKECGRMAENLEMQMPYILQGQVELVHYDI
jgi:hypothetical protein